MKKRKFKFDRHTLYSIEELKDKLPISPELFIERMGIKKRFNGVVLGADVIRAMEKDEEEIPAAKSFKTSSVKKAKAGGLSLINVKEITR